MALDTKEEIYQALRDNRERAEGRARAAIAEEIADAAEAFGDPEVVVSALVEQISAYYGSGESVKVPVAFARLLRLWDDDPKYFDEYETHRLFWYFKWVTSGLLTTPDVPLASIRGWVDEMQRRYTTAEKGMQPVAAQRFHVARHIGADEDLAYDLWATRGRTRLSDCVDCEARGRAQYWIDRGDDDRAVTELAAALRGQSNCQEEPQASQAVALLPLARLGRLDEARTAHLTGYRAVRGREAFVGSVGEHLEFCALSGNEARGLELLAQNRSLFSFGGSQLARLEFLVGAEVLLTRLAAAGYGDAPCGGPVGREWTVSALLAVVSQEAAELAARFDERNGTGAVSARRTRRLAASTVVELNLGVRTAAPRGAGSPGALSPGADPAAGEAGASGPDRPRGGSLSGLAGLVGLAPVVVPEDFAELVAEARRLDKTGHPSGRQLWSAVLARSADNPEAVDDLLRGEIAAELAHRAYADKDWDEARRQFQAAAKHYEAAGRPARVVASEARDVWAEAVADGTGDPVAAAEAAWPRLDGLLGGVLGVLAEVSGVAGITDTAEAAEPAEFCAPAEFVESADGPAEFSAPAVPSGPDSIRDTQRMVLVVRNSRCFVARNAGLLGEGEAAERWAAVFKAEAAALVEQAEAFDMPGRASLVHELLAEYDATHGEPEAAEAAARRALDIFEAKDWPWRKHRGRLLLALALAGQRRFAEAVDELQVGLAEVYPGIDPEEVTPLHRLLGDVASQSRDHATAVRAYSEAAVRLEREGSLSAAVETRWRLSGVLFATGQTADGVAVLETLTDEAAEEVFDVPPRAEGSATAAESREASREASEEASQETSQEVPQEASQRAADAPAGAAAPDPARGVPARTAELAVQIRLDLAHGLARLGEHREAAYEYLRVAQVVGSWQDRTLLTFAAGGAARSLAYSKQWEGARLALQRALDSHSEAPFIPELSQVLRDLADAAVEDRGAEAVEEALGYIDDADRLRSEAPEIAQAQFISVAFDEAQCLYSRGKVLYTADRDEEALAALDHAIGVFDASGHETSPARFETVRAAAVVEMKGLGRVEAGRARLDRAIVEAEAAGQSDGAVILRQLRDAN